METKQMNIKPVKQSTADKAGSKIIMQTYPVLDMSCASCAVSVESILKSQEGVVNARVNYASASVQVEYQKDVITSEQLRKAVQDIGYDLLIDESGGQEEALEEIQQKKYHQLRWRTIGAGVLSIPVVIIGMFYMNMPYANEIMWVLSTPVVLWFGKDFFINA
jgi:P-type Cu2+ transporter